MKNTPTEPKAARQEKVAQPAIGKYGKAVTVCSIDPKFTAWAVIRPYTSTVWFKTVEEAELACEEYNRREIPRDAISEAEGRQP